MIQSFRHKVQKKFFEAGITTGIQPQHAQRLRILMVALDTAQSVQDMNVPGFRLHQLKGRRSGVWSASVNGNWRITYEFRDGQAYNLDYEDNH